MGAKLARELRREEITTAARDLFSRKGFHGTSMPDIARAAGISTGLIYYIFPSKEDILLACCQEVATLHLDFFAQTVDIANPLERFDFIVRELYKDLDDSSKRILIMYRDSSTLPRETRQGILSMIKNLDKHFLKLFE
jgi:AcrR family transcriptional regulator